MLCRLRCIAIGLIALCVALYAGSGGYSTGYNGGTWDVRFIVGQICVTWNLPAQPAAGFYREPCQDGFFVLLFNPRPRPPGRNIAIPIWVAGVIGGLLLLILQRAASRPDGRCRQCHYDLTGNTTGRCPECGTTVALAKL